MREIGGYLQLDLYSQPMLHEGAIALNSGRNCLAYLIRKKKIKKIWIPKFLCASVADVCRRENVDVNYYSIDLNFTPLLEATEEWTYIVNFYGQISNDKIIKYKQKYPKLIIDNVQSYYQRPIAGVDTIYTCRKFFGVTDGAFLYSDVELDKLETDESFERIHFLLGRFERSASEFYGEFVSEEEKIGEWDVKRMSKLTSNLLHGIDYERVKGKRKDNYQYLHSSLGDINKLVLIVPDGPYMYPLYIENGAEIRKALQAENIFIPTLWPDVLKLCNEGELEYDLAKNILPLPIDQRYGIEDMAFVVNEINKQRRL